MVNALVFVESDADLPLDIFSILHESERATFTYHENRSFVYVPLLILDSAILPVLHLVYLDVDFTRS